MKSEALWNITLQTKKDKSLQKLGIEPRFSRPQRDVLTTGRFLPNELKASRRLCGQGGEINK
jgi:hypothetical protein